VSSSLATRRRTLPTALLLSGGFIVAADARVAAPLLPAIADDLHVSIGAAGLTVAFYSLA
jgi:predicted MFS family arabinose efflux permease